MDFIMRRTAEAVRTYHLYVHRGRHLCTALAGEVPGERVVEEVAALAAVGVTDESAEVVEGRNEELECGYGRPDASPPVSERVSSPLPKFVTRKLTECASNVLSTAALGSLPCTLSVISWGERWYSKFPCAYEWES